MIKATQHGYELPDGCTIAIVKDGQVIESGTELALALFEAAGDVYLDEMDRFIDRNQLKQPAATV
tara:strand:+ start:436 stop:630 length:195 start_codon:yes stop_codon:yes gene_type:complete